ncbi:hypothetical protein V3C99_001704 [Haemonchus contortus]
MASTGSILKQGLSLLKKYQVFRNAMSLPTISQEDVLQKFETFLFDGDGTLWDRGVPVPGAIDFVATLRQAGKRFLIVSNNPTRTIDQNLSMISKMGFEGFTEKNVITPAIVLAAYLRDRPAYAKQPVYLLGNDSIKEILESEGNVRCFGSGSQSAESHSEENPFPKPKAVISAWEPHLSHAKITKAAQFLEKHEVDFLVTDEDYAIPVPSPGTELPRSGCPSSIIQVISGRIPTVIGKPHKPMADFLMNWERIDPAKTIMFGDRLETDIQFANENGFTSCLVLTGVHSQEDVRKAEQRGQKHLVPHHVFKFS